MTKKRYIAPQMESVTLNHELPLCQSQNQVKSKGYVEDILFGGVDTGGGIEPSIKELTDFGDDFNTFLW